MTAVVEIKETTVEVRGLPDFSSILGCLSLDETHIHLGALFVRRTVCGKPMGTTLLSRDVTVSCPECVAELKYRNEHPEAAKEDLGVVTHKRKVEGEK